MQTLRDLHFWLGYAYFFGAIFIAFFIPGDVISRRLQLKGMPRLVIATVIGLVAWTYQGMVFGLLGARWLTYGYLGLMIILWFYWQRYKLLSRDNIHKFTVDDPLAYLIVAAGTAVQLVMMWYQGFNTGTGMYFCCGLPDSLYHIALTHNLLTHFPPFEIGTTSISVTNYHYLTNLMYADLIRVFRLPLVLTQYPYMGLAATLLLGLTVKVTGDALKIGKTFVRWLLFFLFFSGDLIYLLFLLTGRGLNFHITVLHDATDLWYSPPRVFAALIFFAAVYLYLQWQHRKDTYSIWLLALLFAITAGFKIYMDIFVMFGLLVLACYRLIKRDLSGLYLFLLTLLITLAIYLPVNRAHGSLEFAGMWRFENFMAEPTAVNLVRIELKRLHFVETHNYLMLFGMEIAYVVAYFIFNFGTLLLGFVQSKRSFSLLPKSLHLLLLPGIVGSLIVGSFFFQNPGHGNTAQFLITTEIVLSVYAALACAYWLPLVRLRWRFVLIGLIVVFTAARVGYEAGLQIQKMTRGRGVFIPTAELAALEFLKDKTPPDAVILTDPRFSRDNICYYMSFMTERQMYLCGMGILEDHGHPTKDKYTHILEIFVNKSPQFVSTVIKQNQIDYLYFRTAYLPYNLQKVGSLYHTVFRNDKIVILRLK